MNEPIAELRLDKDINFRITGLDFEYLRKQSIKYKITISNLLRHMISEWRKETK